MLNKYCLIQGDTSVVVLIALCFGVGFLLAAHHLYFFKYMYLVKSGKLSGHLLG